MFRFFYTVVNSFRKYNLRISFRNHTSSLYWRKNSENTQKYSMRVLLLYYTYRNSSRSVEYDAVFIRYVSFGALTSWQVSLCIYGYTSESMDQPGKVANPARGQLNSENEYFPVRVRA